MKHFIFIIPVLLASLFMACTKEEPEIPPDALSECLSIKVEAFKVDQATCENASVKKYAFQFQEVYVFTQGICISDGGSDVLLEDCSSVCFLGGLAGFQDCNGELFFDVAEELETIWEFK